MRQIFLLIVSILLTSGVQAQKDRKLSDWDIIYYCSTNNSIHPNRVVNADNNWQLLLAMQDSISLKKVDSLNINYNTSQILLLQTQRLIANKNGLYKAKMPILNNERTKQIRQDSRKTAEAIFPDIQPDCQNLVHYLKDKNLEYNSFCLMFSYILDGIFWKELERRQLIDKRDETNIWGGYAWALDYKRTFNCGTNTLSSGDKYTIHFNWADPLLNYAPAKKLFAWSFFEKFLDELEKNDKINDPEIINEWSEINTVDNNGNLIIPVITENDTDEIYRHANIISKKLVDSFIKRTPMDHLCSKYDFPDSKKTIVIFYHEVMWDLIDIMIEQKIIEKPQILISPENCKMDDVGNIFFITKE